ncbi:unnamed protein product [Paramecium sonneborni]|uniref:Uncharacterized protein n=1 Tax=Paramecium sonneborni TaxID=65129 RepID=A0A8S1NQM8_9CILI|nr:unnamed protein product [Paramecium sonneborni]
MEEDISIKKSLDVKQNEILLLQNDMHFKKDELAQEQQLHYKSQYQILDRKTQQSYFEQKLNQVQVELQQLNLIIKQQQNQTMDYIQQISDMKNQNSELQLRMSKFDEETTEIIKKFNQEILTLKLNYDIYEQSYKQLETIIEKLNEQIDFQDESKQKNYHLNEHSQKNLIKQLQDQLQKSNQQIKDQYQQTIQVTNSVSIQTDTIILKQVIQNEEVKLRDVEYTINFIINNLDIMKEKINQNKNNINDLLSFKQMISNQITKQLGKIKKLSILPYRFKVQNYCELRRFLRFMNCNCNYKNKNNKQKIQNSKKLKNIFWILLYQIGNNYVNANYNRNTINKHLIIKIMVVLSNQRVQIQKMKIKVEAQLEIAKENLRLRKKIAILENQEMKQS